MITRTAHILFLAITIAILSQSAFAYRLWEPEDGIPIRQGDEINSVLGIDAISAENGSFALVAWSDARTTDQDIYAQLYDENGAPQWAEGGIRIGGVEGSCQAHPVVLAVGENAWIIAWTDYRNDTASMQYSDIFMQKVDNSGAIQWPSGAPDYAGVAVSEIQSSIEICPYMFDDGNGGVRVAWISSRNGNADIFAMHFLADGTADPAWPEGGQVVAGGVGDQGTVYGTDFVAVPDGQHGIIALWADNRDPNNQNYYMNRLNSAGELVWADQQGLAITQNNLYSFDWTASADGAGGAWIVWRNDLELSLCGQHITTNGALDWAGDGLTLADVDSDVNPNGPSSPELISVDEEVVVLAWRIAGMWGLSFDSFFMQRISLDEQRQPVLEWTVNEDEEEFGIVLCDADSSRQRLNGISDGNGGVVFSWLDGRESASYFNGYTVFSQRVNSEGSSVWNTPEGIQVCTQGGARYALVHEIVGDHVLLVWNDRRYGNNSIYTQVQSLSSGEVLLADEGQAVFTGINGDGVMPEVVFDPDFPDDVWFAWLDGRFGNYGKIPFFQKVYLQTGQAVFETDGMNAIPYYPFNEGIFTEVQNCDSVKMVSDGEGGIYLGWHTSFAASSGISLQHILSDGTLDWGDEGIHFPIEDMDYLEYPFLLPAHGGGVFVGYSQESDTYIPMVKIQKVDTNGDVLWQEEGEYGIVLTEVDDRDYWIVDLDYFDDGEQTPPVDATLAVLYTRNSGAANLDIYMSGVSQTGEIQWQTRVCTENNMQRCPQMIPMTGGMLVVWMDYRNGNTDIDVYGQYVYPDGSFAWAEDGIVLANSDGMIASYYCSSVCDSTFWLTWSEPGVEATERIWVQKYDMNGQPLFESAPGVAVTDGQDFCRSPKSVSTSDDGVYLMWETGADRQSFDLYCTRLDAEGRTVEEMPLINGVPLTQAHHSQMRGVMVPDGNDGAVAVWEDYRATEMEYVKNIYAQYINIFHDGVDGSNKGFQPNEWSLDTAYPNPFNPSTQIGFSLDQRMPVTLTVYDVLGRQVVKLVEGVKDAGRHVVTWNGMDTHGRAVASGTYFYKLEGDGKQLVQKMVLVK